MHVTRPLALAAVLLISTAACGGPGDTTDALAGPDTAPPASAPPAGAPAPVETADPTDTTSPSPAPLADPTFPTGVEPARITIPAIGVDAPFTAPLGMLSATEMETPTDPDDVGWFSLSRLPGEIGPAIIAGHVDSRTGPAVFHRLRDLEPGDEVTIHADDGTTRVFVVEDRGQFPKDALPEEVFGYGADRPELRLITCGGSFDRSTGHYRDNVVVFARLAGT